MTDLTNAESLAILIIGSCAVLVLCIVASVRILLAPLRQAVIDIRHGHKQITSLPVVSAEPPTEIRGDANPIPGTCPASPQLAQILSQVQSARLTDTDILAAIELLNQAIRGLETAVMTNYSSMLGSINSLLSEDKVTKAKTYLEGKLAEQSAVLGEHSIALEKKLAKNIDERSRASVRRDRSFLASSYPRLLAIISADLNDGEWQDLEEQAENSEIKAETASNEKTQSRIVCWKAKISVLPLCENRRCPNRSSRLRAIRVIKNDNKFEYTIKNGRLYLSPELLATGGVFVVRFALVAIPHTGVLQHALEIAGISPALVKYVSSLKSGLFPTKVIEELSKETVKSAAEDFGEDTTKMILEQLIETSRSESRMPHLQQEVENCLTRGRVAVLNVGGTAHLELGRLMEKEDRDGHVPFGGLARILTDDGEYLWACEDCQHAFRSNQSERDPRASVAA